MKITISGLPGAGKTTIAKMLAKKLKYEHWSLGDIRGEIAKKHHMTIDQLNEVGKKEIWTDKEVDDFQKKMGEKRDNFIMEAWIGFHFIPDSIKIFLEVDMKEGARRIFLDQREDEEPKENAHEVEKMIKKRLEGSRERYKKYYGIKDFTDRKQFDIVINTTKLTKKEVVKEILGFLSLLINKKSLKTAKL
ncbi:MAG: cytidylate kinase family protein [Candidatus Pacearchaeota archaeon]|nr:cytidylate kinase family protein [Candidatus Pacearchaeota archaeon]